MSSAKYKTFRSDAAPFFFYIDVLPMDLSQYDIPHHVDLLKKIQFNPIMPLPLRVDRAFNGESSTLIKPRNPISFSIGEEIALINPTAFVQSGIEKLLFLTEVRASREFTISLQSENAKNWWNSTKHLYGRLKSLEEDFSAFLKAYLYIVVKAKVNNEDLISAATQYCELIRDMCYQRIQENNILVEIKDKEKFVALYKMKKGHTYEKFKREERKLLYPSFVDIELLDLKEIGFSHLEEEKNSNFMIKYKSKTKAYIPLLLYDDLLECMLQNCDLLNEFEGEILDPSYLLKEKVILIFDKEDKKTFKEYTWLKDFSEIDLDSILKSIEPTFSNF
jgi:hypothetical protein